MNWMNRLPDYSVAGYSESTVFLLHGIYGSKEYWQFITKRLLGAGYRVVAWDAPGYGLSEPDDRFTLMSATDVCCRLIGKVGTARNVVLGQSMGGQIAMRVCQRIPALVHGVIIASTIGYLGNQTPEEQEEFVRTRTSTDQKPSLVEDKNLSLVTSMMAPNASGPEVDLVKAIGAATPGHAVQAAVKAVQAVQDEEAISALKSISVPALFIAGELDQTGRPSGMRRIADMVPNSQFEVIAGCGHYAWAEDSSAFWSKVEPFLESAFTRT